MKIVLFQIIHYDLFRRDLFENIGFIRGRKNHIPYA